MNQNLVFLPSIGSFGQAVSEEKIVLEIDQSERRIACGGHVCCHRQFLFLIGKKNSLQ
jgi:hypothetical protein